MNSDISLDLINAMLADFNLLSCIFLCTTLEFFALFTPVAIGNQSLASVASHLQSLIDRMKMKR